MKMIEHVTVEELKPLAGFKLWLRFSNGTTGVRNFADILAEEGEVILPLRDESMFMRAYVSFGAPTWPSGLQLDPSVLHMELREAGELRHAQAAE